MISFMKNVGAKLFGKSNVADSTTSMDGVINYIDAMELKVSNLAVNFDSATSTATVTGEAPDIETKEKVVLCVGNVDGVESVDDKMTCPATLVSTSDSAPISAQSDSDFYQVKSGDTLSKIAKNYYGDANKYQAIFDANRPMLTHPDKIYPGQTLRIPKR